MTATPTQRAEATQKTIDRYRDKPFDWAGANCIRLARLQGSAMGHNLPPVPVFKTALGAKRALRKQGVDDVTGLLDKYFPRHLSPAFLRLGDLCTLEGEDGLEAVCIADGMGNLFGWHDDRPEGLATIKFADADIKAAWRL